jgi:hypothetical protein
LVLAVLTVGVAACGTAAIQNVTNDPFAGRATSLDQRATQIKRAATGLGWIVQDTAPGEMKATLNVQSHQAVVTIKYNLDVYSIRYASSQNLNYDGTQIDSKYNDWIENLRRAIHSQSTVA